MVVDQDMLTDPSTAQAQVEYRQAYIKWYKSDAEKDFEEFKKAEKALEAAFTAYRTSKQQAG